MKSIIRFIALLLICTFLAGAMTSCALFEKSSAIDQHSFKHKKPLPKRYIIHDKTRDIIK